MTEEEARAWIVDRYGIDAHHRIASFLDRVAAESAQQNLVSPATIQHMWARHAVDSAQLLLHAPDDWRTWLDVGTGAGFPGMIVALLRPERQIALIEPRRKRVTFLEDAARALQLMNVSVIAARVETIVRPVDVISARAVASVEKLLRAAAACASAQTTWLLPRGQSGRAELAQAGPGFHVEQSLTDPLSVIGIYRGFPK